MATDNMAIESKRHYRKRGNTPDLPVVYRTTRGQMLNGKIENFLDSDVGLAMRGKVKLLFTSPPYPLNRKKRYGNLTGDEYLKWLIELAPRFRELLMDDGSLVVEIGNSWNPGTPTMSTLALEALLAILKSSGMHLCQQFICHNPARLPSPVQWVNVERIRVKDSFTHVWWMSPSTKPQADNRKVLTDYSASMKHLLKKKSYNSGRRPSEHVIGDKSFLTNNGGAIPPSVLTISNTRSDEYTRHCSEAQIDPHPARMPVELAEFFIKFLTNKRNLVFDPFAGSNTTGAVAEQLKRRWCSVEANNEYAVASKSRFKKQIVEEIDNEYR